MKSMTRFEKARLAAIILAVVFYVVARIGCINTFITFDEFTGVAGTFLPVIVNIFATLAEMGRNNIGDYNYAQCALQLVLQISGLGLAWLSILIAYITNALCKWEYKLGNS